MGRACSVLKFPYIYYEHRSRHTLVSEILNFHVLGLLILSYSELWHTLDLKH